MKKFAFALLLVSFGARAEFCADLSFEGEGILCTYETERAEQAVGTPGFTEALNEKVACLEAFRASCADVVKSEPKDVCADLRFEAQDFLCTLEAATAEVMAGTDGFQEALKAKLDCQEAFTKSCLAL